MAKCGYVTLNVHLRDYFGGECGRGIWETICFFWHCQRNCVETIWLYFVILCSTFDVCTQRGLYDFWQWISTHIYSYSPLRSSPNPHQHTHTPFSCFGLLFYLSTNLLLLRFPARLNASECEWQKELLFSVELFLLVTYFSLQTREWKGKRD